jgi:uncharacterized protein
MPLSIHDASVPVFTRTLRNLRAILEKGAAHAAARKIQESALLGARLFPDMQPLSFQVQVVTDMARGGAARLAGQEPPAFDDKEATFAQLIDRIDRTLAFIASLDRKAFDGADERTITRPVRGEPHAFTAANYLQQFVLPNLYFHAAMAYGLLRHNGVELGKADFLGKLD